MQGRADGGSLITACAGVPNVLAMNQMAGDPEAIEFASVFYARLADMRSLEQALTDARRSVCETFGDRQSRGGFPPPRSPLPLRERPLRQPLSRS